MILLKPVVQMFPAKEKPDWEVATFPKGYFLSISEHLTLPEIGAVMALVLLYNLQATLADAIAEEVLVLPGGMGVYVDEELIVTPGCCCGLESLRGWESFLDTGETPWCGHDPETELTWQESDVKISHSNGHRVKNMTLSLQDYRKNLIAVEKSLQGFVFALEAWGYMVGFSEPRILAAKFDKCFHVGVRW